MPLKRYLAAALLAALSPAAFAQEPLATPPPATSPAASPPAPAPDAVSATPPARHPVSARRRGARRGRSARSTAGASRTLMLEAGVGRVIQLNGSPSNVFAADPKVADVRPASTTSLFVFGVAPGRTTVAAVDAAGHMVADYDVVVLPSGFTGMATRNGIAGAAPKASVKVATLGNGIVVDGSVANAGEADRVTQVARGFLPKDQYAVNNLQVKSSIQVNLRVRVIEMSRNLTRDLGINWSGLAHIGTYATLSGATENILSNLTTPVSNAAFSSRRLGIDGMVEALAQDQLVHLLAEPNLTALSGETASFLVGGEFPIPVAQQNNQTTIEFKQYGVSLAFVPTVISDGHISLKVRPEVSQLTSQGAIVLSSGNASIQVPALTVRRAETTVELGSGQSFAIAGLLQDNATTTDNAVPFLGELPILGALFRSDAFQRNETELVIIVTPYIVRPVSDPTALVVPTDGYPIPNDFERLLLLRQVGRPKPPAAGVNHRPIDAGFVVQ